MPLLPGAGWLHARALAADFEAFARVHLLRAGLRLGLFESLRQPQGAEALAGRLGLVGDLVGTWLVASERVGLLRSAPAGYQITDFTRWLLDAPEAAALHARLDQVVLGWGPRFEDLPQLLKGADRPRYGGSGEAQRAAAAARTIEASALSALARIPGARSARRVLDVGCGQGSYLASFLAHYRDAQGVGVDLDPAVAEEARRRLREAEVWRRGEIRVGDFMTLELPGRFDLILLNNNLHYFSPADHDTLLRRILAHLTPGGVLAIQTGVVASGSIAQLFGAGAATALQDLFQRAHSNLYGLTEPATLHEELRCAGFEATGEVPVLPGGSALYVWARASREEGLAPSGAAPTPA